MTRYILFPKSSNSCFTLHSTISDDSKDIFIPSDIVCDISIFDDVHNKIRLKNLLFVLSENGIFRTKDGFIGDKYSIVNIKYNKAIINTCNYIFKEEFEEFYCMLRNNNITF